MTPGILPLLAGTLLLTYYLFLSAIFALSLYQSYLLLLYWRRPPSPPPPPAPKDHWPKVTIQLPLYNEPAAAPGLLHQVARIEYPREQLEIQVLDDSTDDTPDILAPIIAQYRQQGLSIHHIRRPHRQGFKAGALAYGCSLATGEYFALFDADFRPRPDFLLQTLPWLLHHPRMAVVQTRWSHLNEDHNCLTRLQAFQLNVHFHIEQSVRSAYGYFLQFNGTAGLWRRSAIAAAGGWQGDTLTEDLDLSYRAQIMGWQIHYQNELASPGELPANLPSFRSQQYRWMKGGAETARKIWPMLWSSTQPLRHKAHGSIHLLAGAVYLLLLGSALLSIPLPFLLPYSPISARGLPVFLIGLTAVVLLFYHGNPPKQLDPPATRLRRIPAFLWRFLHFMALSLGMSLHNSRAVIAGWRRQPSPFVRTPKGGGSAARSRQQPEKKTHHPGVPEALVALLFTVALLVGWATRHTLFIPYHLLAAYSFGSQAIQLHRAHVRES